MLLQNKICQIKISKDETYTVESSVNFFYNIVLNPHHFKKNDMYKTFSIQIDLLLKSAQQQVQQQFELGEITKDQYDVKWSSFFVTITLKDFQLLLMPFFKRSKFSI